MRFFLLITLNFIMVSAYAEMSGLDHSLEISTLNSKIENLNLDKKINKSLFLPELYLSGGVGSEKLRDNSYETEKGPFIFLNSKLNLYRGGRDISFVQKNSLQSSLLKIDLEIQKRNLSISAFKIMTAINSIIKENKLIEQEIESNNSQQAMARKKLNAGLTSSIDLIDFELKKDSLNNEIENNTLKKETLQAELKNLFGGHLSSAELELMSSKMAAMNLDSIPTNYEDSPKLALTKKKIALSRIDQDNVKAEYLPTIDLEAKWGQLTPQEKFFNATREHQVALTLTIPLFTGFSTDYKFQQAVNESAQVKRELLQEELETKSLQEIELKKIVLAKKILLSLKNSLNQTVKYKDLTISEYKRGIKNSPDIISASDKKLEVERKILEAQNTLAISLFTLSETFRAYSAE